MTIEPPSDAETDGYSLIAPRADDPPSEFLPDDTVIGLAQEDYDFIQAYTRGEVTEEEFRARYERDGRIAIPVTIVDPGTRHCRHCVHPLVDHGFAGCTRCTCPERS